MPMNSKTMRMRTFHPEATAWRKAVIANSGTVSATTMRAVSNFCTAISAAGIRSKFLRLSLMCGNNVAAACVPLYRGASATGTQYGSTVDTNNGPFVAEDYSLSTGLDNGNAKYLDTGLKLGTLKTFGADFDNVHCAAYVRADTIGPTMGAYDYNDVFLSNGITLVATNNDGFYGNTTPSFLTGENLGGSEHMLFGGGFSLGFSQAEFTAASTGTFQINATTLSAFISNNSSTSFDAVDQTPFCIFNDSTSVGDQTLSAYSVGLPMGSNANRTAFFNAMLAFQTALRRNV